MKTATAPTPSLAEGAAWYLLGALLFLGFGFTEMAGADLWWHLAGGREILDQGTLWLRDTWSYSAAGERWRNHEWLADLVYYGWYSLFGLKALLYWKLLVVVLCYGLLQSLLYRLCGSHAAALLLTVMALAVGAPFIDIRPHLYSLLAFVLLLHLGVRRAPFWQFALLFLVWVNLHGGFMLGLLVLPFLLFPFNAPSWDAVWKVAKWELGCVAVCVLNPDGVKVVIYPLTYALQAESPFRSIAEWLPPWTPGGIQSPLFFWVLPLLPLSLLCWLLPVVRRSTTFPWWSLGVALLTLAMALTSRRFIPLFGIALAVFMAPACGALLGLLRGYWRWGLWLAALVLGLYRLAPYPLQAAPAFHYLTAEYSFPHFMVEVMQRSGIRGKVFAYYNWGGYLHLRTDGAVSVYIDGRANTLYDDQTYLNYVSVLRGDPGWMDIVEQSGADYFLWPSDRGNARHKIRDLVQQRRWQPVFRTGSAILLARPGVALPRTLDLGPATEWSRLSEGWRQFLLGNYTAAVGIAEGVLEDAPYLWGACNLLTASHRQLGDEAAAAQALADCLSQFPSRYLR
ncbi:hypothetical protein FV139_10750 [Parahaliea maris]|uniref:Uncharacterized protein n=1 Tax=Parahaliea maris TaxID=2716870 RepID=A0A5C9A003_9GAMM|nr:hypothetical protein [Parahaliea maris]TXS94078.1 hypothetical protein FV139_10750 [Parahaliea maris]